MSHLQNLNAARYRCSAANQCEEYQAILSTQDQDIDTRTAQANQQTLVFGGLVALVGLVLLFTPFVKLLRRIMQVLLPALAILAPVLVGLAAGAVAGFAISFSACFKQTCSQAESTAVLTIPLLTLLVTLPLARLVYKRRMPMAKALGASRPRGWLIAGAVVLCIAAVFTMNSLSQNKHSGEVQKDYLRRLEL